jgi:hypothetical protein
MVAAISNARPSDAVIPDIRSTSLRITGQPARKRKFGAQRQRDENRVLPTIARSTDWEPRAKPRQLRGYCAPRRKSQFEREWVLADAVACEPVSTVEFPANREINREFRRIRAPDAILFADTGTISKACSEIPYATEQGNILTEQGILSKEQGISTVNTGIVSGCGFRYTQVIVCLSLCALAPPLRCLQRRPISG